MKILHTSDLHLGIHLHGVSLLEEQQAMVEFLLETAVREEADGVVICGDVFDRAVSSPEALRLYDRLITGLCRERKIPTVIIAGNHDGAERLAAGGKLLEEAGLYIRGRIGREREPVCLGNVMIHPFPYFNGDEVRALFPGEEIRSAAQGMEVLCREEERPQGYFHLLMAHCFVGGAALSESDRAAAVGGAAQIPGGIFEGFDYVALGHLHRPQQVGKGIRYSGSPLPYSFSESGYDKTISLLDTDTGLVREIAVPMKRRLRVVSGTLEELLDRAERDPSPDDYLKVELTDCPATMERVELFRDRYPNLLLLTGRQSRQEGEDGGITVEQLERMSPEDLMLRFCREVLEEEPDDQVMGWFRQAAQEAEKEGDLQ